MERAGRIAGKLKLASGVSDPSLVACAAWKMAAGKKIAQHARAVALVRGKLVIEVDDILWQRQLFGLRHFLMKNLAKELGEAVVTDLDFRPLPRRFDADAFVIAVHAREVFGVDRVRIWVDEVNEHGSFQASST